MSGLQFRGGDKAFNRAGDTGSEMCPLCHLELNDGGNLPWERQLDLFESGLGRRRWCWGSSIRVEALREQAGRWSFHFDGVWVVALGKEGRVKRGGLDLDVLGVVARWEEGRVDLFVLHLEAWGKESRVDLLLLDFVARWQERVIDLLLFDFVAGR